MNKLLSDKYILFFLPVVVFIITLFFSYNLTQNYDTWFHIKSGEVILNQGIIHHDVFSYVSANRDWTPYEWLFQVGIFLFTKFFGLEAIKYLIAILTAITITIIYKIVRKLFNASNTQALIAVTIFFTANFRFFTARPQIVAFIFLIINLGLIFLYLLKNRNLLVLTIPVTLIWANLHASIALDVLFFFGYFFICLINYILLKEKEWLKKAKVLFIFSLITSIFTILPPLGLAQYEFLLKIFQNSKLISSFITEWYPLAGFSYAFYTYTLTLLIVFAIFFYSIFTSKQFVRNIIPLLPFIFIPLMGYTSARNIFYGYFAFSILLAFGLSKINFNKTSKALKIITLTLLGILLIIQGYYFYSATIPSPLYFPVNATKFIKDVDIKGNMFNEFRYGGYLLYHLYPQKKIFIDGRTDFYLCCELKQLSNLYKNQTLPDKKYKLLLDNLWNKYQMSFILIQSSKIGFDKKVARILINDPKWILVFWDDNSQIFVKNDGKNIKIINKFGAKFATPLEQIPFRRNSSQKSLPEYQKMIRVSDSARSRNAIGLILGQQKEYGKAQKEFEKAIELDQSFESPYMNLAEIEIIQNKNYDLALRLYKDALSLSPDRPFIYLRLGQIYIQGFNDKENALEIWKKGLERFDNSQTKETFNKYINSYK